MITVKSNRELDIMREAAQKLKFVFQGVRDLVRSGVRTIDIDKEAEKLILSQGAKPAFKGYRGYPSTVCISINEEVVHGIPSNRKIQNGDIVSLDMGLVWRDFYSDSARTWPVGNADPKALELIEVTKQAMYAGMEQMRPGAHIGDVSAAIQKRIENNGFGIVRDYVGHGIGRALHEDPQVPNFGTRGRGPKLQVGMTLALEPMVTMGASEVKLLDDDWTVVTKDGKWASHYEDTIALTENGPENLTGT